MPFSPILVSPSELFCCFWLQTPALKSWGINGLLPSSLGSGNLFPSLVPAPHLRARSLRGLYRKLKQCHETKGGDCMEKLFSRLCSPFCWGRTCKKYKVYVCVKGRLWLTPAICTEAVNGKCRASKGSGGILIATATRENAVQTLHNLFVPKPGSNCPSPVFLFPF